MKISNNIKGIIGKIIIALGAVLVIFAIWYSDYMNKKASEIKLKSRYTFTVTINTQGELVNKAEALEASDHILAEDFGNLKINEIGDIWIREFIGQFTQRYLSRSKSLKNVEINDTDVLDEKNNTVLISFSAVRGDSTSEYFSSWKGVLEEGRLHCDWVVKFDIDNHYDGTATIYVDSMLTPEDYGIYQYNESIKANENNNSDLENELTNYVIRDSALYVTYDGGGSYVAVPVALDNLMIVENGNARELKPGCAIVSTTKTAIIYGGKIVNGDRIPVTMVCTDDLGKNWTTCELEQIYTADYLYIDFFDVENGIAVVGYDRGEQHESSRIYVTDDGGITWNVVGTGPTTGIIKGVKFIDEKIGFFCYNYVSGMDSNLYITKDGGKTFSKITFEAQELDSTPTDRKLTWNEVYKEALVPIYDKDGVVTVYITQGSGGVYNGGKTAAKYQSSDKGNTWKYIGQYEIDS